MRAFAHLLLVLALSSLAALFLGSVEGVEVCTFVVVQSLRVLVDDVGCDFVEESSVVGHDQDSTGIACQIVRQESD